MAGATGMTGLTGAAGRCECHRRTQHAIAYVSYLNTPALFPLVLSTAEACHSCPGNHIHHVPLPLPSPLLHT